MESNTELKEKDSKRAEFILQHWFLSPVWYIPMEYVASFRNEEDDHPIIFERIKDEELPAFVEKKEVWECDKCHKWSEDKEDMYDECDCLEEEDLLC